MEEITIFFNFFPTFNSTMREILRFQDLTRKAKVCCTGRYQCISTMLFHIGMWHGGHTDTVIK